MSEGQMQEDASLASVVTAVPLRADALAPLRRLVRVIAIILMLLIGLLPVWIPYALGFYRVRSKMVQYFFAVLCRVLGLHVLVHGNLVKDRPLLIVSNHISYLDIFAIGSVLPVAFTPKLEISRWPVIGYLCRMAGCVFIDRRPRAVDEHRAMLDARLARGERIVLFAEGTTSDGRDVLPFRGAFFRMIEWEYARSGKPLAVQPMALTYTHLDSKVITDGMREQVAWVGDAEFVPHWLALMGYKRVDVVIDFLPVFYPEPTAERKELAAHCENAVRTSIQHFAAEASVLPA
jgi:1-acyl-sn-glycerol-3-phosphate acyltransferase